MKGEKMFYKNKISIIVPAYNAEEYLERCIESILKQSYKNIEIIIVNDGSSDYTGVISSQYSEKFSEKIKYYEIEHGGPGAARNEGLRHATGEYIGFVDADDDIHVNMYKEMLACANKKSADIVVCNVKLHDLDKNESIVQKSINFGELTIDNYMQYGINLCSPCNKIFKRRIFDQYEFENMTYEDSELIPVIISYAKHVEFVEKHFYNYYYRVGSTSNCVENFSTEDFFRAIINSINKVNSKYKRQLAYWHARSILKSMYGSKKYYFNEFVEFVEKNKGLFEDNNLIEQDCYVKNILKLKGNEEFQLDIDYDFTLLSAIETRVVEEIINKQSITKCNIQILKYDKKNAIPWKEIKGKFFTIIDRNITIEKDFIEKLYLYSKIYGENSSMIAIPTKNKTEKNEIINIEKKYKIFNPEEYLMFYNTNILFGDMEFPINISCNNCFTYAVLKNPNIYLPAYISANCRVTDELNDDLYQQGMQKVYDEVFSNLKFSMSLVMGIPMSIQYYSMLKLKQIIETEYFNEIAEEDSFKTFKDTIIKSIEYIDDKILMALPRTTPEHRVYMFKLKYGKEAQLNYNNGKLELVYNGKCIYCQDDTYTLFEFIDYKNKELVLEGRTICLNAEENEDVTFYAVANGCIYPAEILKRECSRYSLGDIIFKGMEFRINIPINSEVGLYTIKFFYLYRGFKIARNDIRFAKFFPLTKKYASSYFKKDDRVLTFSENKFLFRLCGRKGKLIREKNFLDEIKQKLTKDEAEEIIKLRILYLLLSIFMKKRIWVVSDKVNRADDNGEAFFEFLNKNIEAKKEVRSYYIIDKQCNDYKRMKKVGKILPFNSFKHKLFSLISELEFTAYGNDAVTAPMLRVKDCFKDILYRDKIVFLQHGVAQNNYSNALNRYNQNFHGIITSNREEHRSFCEYDYYYKNSQIKLTGLPRFDRHYNDEKKYITFAPTWRRTLFGEYINNEDRYILKEGFLESDYYQFYKGVVVSDKLKEVLHEYGYELHFIPHPVFFPYIDKFEFPDYVKMHGREVSYRTMFAESNLFLTDYSSAVFDFAYMEKPIIYTQFDQKEFYESQYEKGMFDYDRDGFGEVVRNVDETVELIITYIKNDCEIKEEYRDRINTFFAFHDHNNCKRIFEEYCK